MTIEASIPPATLSDAQKRTLARIIAAGGECAISGGPHCEANWSRACLTWLASQRYVVRTPGGDGRAPRVAITPAGRAAYDRAKA